MTVAKLMALQSFVIPQAAFSPDMLAFTYPDSPIGRTSRKTSNAPNTPPASAICVGLHSENSSPTRRPFLFLAFNLLSTPGLRR